ncbi:basic amino acid ABC transporter substrate-binding protein [Zhihengliuella alba]|uniref:Basic amino acid ABC transporter substrate-binding protein n=1 Tax=Zhihengliuella alba TaxID=547018 RepID=A0ABP7D5D7_9MICC
MKITSRAWKAVAIVATAGLALTACSSGQSDEPAAEGQEGLQFVEEGKLTVCSDIPYEPFEFTDENGEIVGLDIDLANEIAKDLELETKIVDSSFDAIESGLFSTQCDLAMSSISITEERKGNMDFSDPYLDDDLMLIARKGSGVTDFESAKGKKVAVQQATTGENYGQENGLETVGYEDAGLQLQALESGQVDAALGNQSVMGHAIKDKDEFEVVDKIATGEQLGIAAAKGNTELIEKVNGTLTRLSESGELDAITEKWLDTK